MSEEIIVVHGNSTLNGEVHVSGAKNSALKLMAASILAQGECVIRNVPLISDIDIMAAILKSLGATLGRNGSVDRDQHTVTLDTSTLDSYETPFELASKMRASISVLGPLIGRFNKASVIMPGGCQIGSRGIELHIRGLEALGVEFETDHGFLKANAPAGLHGAYILLDFPSVGATENILMASVVADGTTTIDNAAREPEISDLCSMLREMGADIEGDGTSTITVRGVPLSSMRPCDHTTIGDRVEAGTFLVGGALSKGPVRACGIDPEFLSRPIEILRDSGCSIEEGPDWIEISRSEDLKPIEIQTLPYPGFPTDLQAQFMLLATFAKGSLSIVTENIFENRFMFVNELLRMGADISVVDHHAFVKPGSTLQGAPVDCTDLRAGAAIVLAGIMADGDTEIHKIHHIDRGYEDYVGKLRSLGADIERVVIENDQEDGL